jgi:hypothetical protein
MAKLITQVCGTYTMIGFKFFMISYFLEIN